MTDNIMKMEPPVLRAIPEHSLTIIKKMKTAPVKEIKDKKEEKTEPVKKNHEPAMPPEPEGYLRMRPYDFF